MRCRNRFRRRRSGRRCPPRTVRCPSPTHLRRVARDATRCPARLEPRQYVVSSKWSEQLHPTWVQCTVGDCCAATTSRCALDMARPPPLWFRLWHYRLVPYIILVITYTKYAYNNILQEDTMWRMTATSSGGRRDCVLKSRSIFH